MVQWFLRPHRKAQLVSEGAGSLRSISFGDLGPHDKNGPVGTEHEHAPGGGVVTNGTKVVGSG